jgi:trans-aconitate methyltransferase
MTEDSPAQELDLIKSEYLDPAPDRRVDQRLNEFVADYVIPRMGRGHALELGVGDFVWTPRLLEQFESVTTLDASKELIRAREAECDDPNWYTVETYFEDYVPESRFDVVFATYVLEHVDDVSAILDKAFEDWLKPGGRIATVVPHALSLHRRLGVAMGLFSDPGTLGDTDRRMGHKRVMTHLDMEELMQKAGFQIIEQQGMISKALPNSQLTSCSDEQLRGLFNLGLDLPIEYSGAIFFHGQKSAQSF